VADLNEIVRSTLALRAFDYRTRLIALEQHLSSDVPLIVANREQVQQILVNLLLNAEQAVRSRDDASVSVRTGHVNGSAFVEIADNGPGVSAEMSGRVFEPFFTTKPVGEGTGLGLSVSLGIAEAHGGSLALVPSAKGACFRLTLPAAAGTRVDAGALSARA
jgi:C4-dicarboxylate-specific signal transduction histidine kinase